MSCDGNCKYRRLYEGSQASLNDLAAKQAAALGRATKLRTSILEAIKQHYPTEYTKAEANLGKQLSSMDDEVIVTYLAAFMSMRNGPAKPSSELEKLREHLKHHGVEVAEGADPETWVEAVKSTLPSEDVPEDSVIVSDEELQGITEPLPSDEELLRIESELLSELFGNTQPPADLAELFDVPEHPPVDLSEDLFSEEPPEEVVLEEGNNEVKEEVKGEPEPSEEESITGGEGEVKLVDQEETVQEPQAEVTPVLKGEQLGLNGPVKPEVVKQGRKQRRKPRVSATAPGASDLQLVKGSGEEPFFLREGVKGLTAEQVDALKDTIAGSGSGYILVKGRNPKQGPLVIPKNIEETTTPWSQCVSSDELRGTPLYEVGTLMARNTGRVLGCVPGKEITTLTLRGNGGTVLAVYLGNAELSGASQLRTELGELLEREVSADYEMIVLLTSARKKDRAASVARIVAEMGEEGSWNVAVPVVAGFSNAYQVNASSNMTHVLP